MLCMYHGTNKKNLNSILKHGLTTINPTNWKGFHTQGFIFLAFDVNVAITYTQAAETFLDDDEYVVFRIKIEDIDERYIRYDQNNICALFSSIESIKYKQNIPPSSLYLLTEEEIVQEPNQNIETFSSFNFYKEFKENFIIYSDLHYYDHPEDLVHLN